MTSLCELVAQTRLREYQLEHRTGGHLEPRAKPRADAP